METFNEDYYKGLVSSLQQTVDSQNSLITELRDQNREMQKTIANLNETLREIERRFFGTSSEKTGNGNKTSKKNAEDNAECEDKNAEANESEDKKPESTESGQSSVPEQSDDQEPKTITVAEHTRKAPGSGKKSKHSDMFRDLPVEYVRIDVPEDQRICPECLTETQMEHLGYEFVREEIVIQEAVVKRIHYIKQKVICPVCKLEGEFTVKAATPPAALICHSVASPSLIAYIMYNKTYLCLPYYRQEDDWKIKGVPLLRSTMSRWYITCALEYLLPIYIKLHEELVKRDLLHCDEVPTQVLREKGKSPQSRSYIWVYLTGKDGKPCIKLYDYKPGRKGSYVREFLDGFCGMIHCDGYAAYGTIENVTRLVCLAHLRRKLFEAIPKNRRKNSMLVDINSEKTVQDTSEELKADSFEWPGEKGVAFCNRLFYLERLYKDLSPEERKSKRKEEEPEVWKEFWKWIDGLNPVGGSKLETAVNYAKNYREELMNYLNDGRCEISNNAAERQCKKYVMMRKNSLFHSTEDGADATAIVMSLIETAKANSLNPEQYLYYLLMYMPDCLDNGSAGIEHLMPWSEFIKEHCSGRTDMITVTPDKKGKLPS